MTSRRIARCRCTPSDAAGRSSFATREVAIVGARLARRADVVYATATYAAAAAATVAARRPLVAKLVSDPAYERAVRYGLFSGPPRGVPGRHEGGKIAALKSLRTASLRRARRLVVPSRYLADIAADLGARAGRIEVLSTPRPRPSTSSRRCFAPNTFVYVGRLSRPKRRCPCCSTRIERVRRRRVLAIVGDGPERAPLEERVEVAGARRPRDVHRRACRATEVLAQLAGARAAVLASVWENLPHAAVEALAVGTPVVATAVGGVPEVVLDDRERPARAAERCCGARCGARARCCAMTRYVSVSPRRRSRRSRRSAATRSTRGSRRFSRRRRVDAARALRRTRAHRASARAVAGREVGCALGAVLDLRVLNAGTGSGDDRGSACFRDARGAVLSSTAVRDRERAPRLHTARRRRLRPVCRASRRSAGRALARSTAKLIVEVHGDPRTFTRSTARAARRCSRRVADAVARRGIAHADATRASRPSRRRLSRRCAAEPATASFPTYSDLSAFADPPPVPVPEEQRVVFVGALEAYKNVDGLAAAWRRVAAELPGATLSIVGEGSRRAVVDRLVADLPGRVEHRPRLSPADVARELDAARALVLPSWPEGLGRVVLEAFARGRAVVGTNGGGIPDIVTDEVDGLLIPRADTPALVARARSACSPITSSARGSARPRTRRTPLAPDARGLRAGVSRPGRSRLRRRAMKLVFVTQELDPGHPALAQTHRPRARACRARRRAGRRRRGAYATELPANVDCAHLRQRAAKLGRGIAFERALAPCAPGRRRCRSCTWSRSLRCWPLRSRRRAAFRFCSGTRTGMRAERSSPRRASVDVALSVDASSYPVATPKLRAIGHAIDVEPFRGPTARGDTTARSGCSRSGGPHAGRGSRRCSTRWRSSRTGRAAGDPRSVADRRRARASRRARAADRRASSCPPCCTTAGRARRRAGARRAGRRGGQPERAAARRDARQGRLRGRRLRAAGRLDERRTSRRCSATLPLQLIAPAARPGCAGRGDRRRSLGPRSDERAAVGAELRRRVVAGHSLEHWADAVIAVATRGTIGAWNGRFANRPAEPAEAPPAEDVRAARPYILAPTPSEVVRPPDRQRARSRWRSTSAGSSLGLYVGARDSRVHRRPASGSLGASLGPGEQLAPVPDPAARARLLAGAPLRAARGARGCGARRAGGVPRRRARARVRDRHRPALHDLRPVRARRRSRLGDHRALPRVLRGADRGRCCARPACAAARCSSASRTRARHLRNSLGASRGGIDYEFVDEIGPGRRGRGRARGARRSTS